MRPFIDKTTGMWKWGQNGKPIHYTRRECEDFGLRLLTDKLRKIKDQNIKAIHGRG